MISFLFPINNCKATDLQSSERRRAIDLVLEHSILLESVGKTRDHDEYFLLLKFKLLIDRPIRANLLYVPTYLKNWFQISRLELSCKYRLLKQSRCDLLIATITGLVFFELREKKGQSN